MLARSLLKYCAITLINYYESIINIFINNILISNIQKNTLYQNMKIYDDKKEEIMI